MTKAVSMLFLALMILTPAFGAPFEGPVVGTVLAGPEVFSTDQASPGELPNTSSPLMMVPFQTEVEQMKLAPPPAPAYPPDAIIQMPPPQQGNDELPVLARLDGIDQTQSGTPDVAMAAGVSDVVEAVNSTWVVFDKTGRRRYTGSLAAMFRGVNPPARIYQPKVFYDLLAQRWVLSALGRDGDKSVWLLAVSQQQSAMGRWWVWKMDAALDGDRPTTNIADDQALGYSDKLVVLTANMFATNATGFHYAKVRVLDKRGLYRGQARTYHDFWALVNENGRKSSSVRPMRGPTGATAFYLANIAPDSGSALNLWELTESVVAPLLVRRSPLAIRQFSAPPDVAQRGTDVRLATGPARLQSLQFQHGNLYCTFHEFYPTTAGSLAGIRYLVVGADVAPRETTHTYLASFAIAVDRTFGSDRTSFFDPSVAVDGRGNAYFAFNYADANHFPGLAVAGWERGRQPMTSILIKPGEAAFLGITGNERPAPFGHTTTVALDPNLDNVAWAAGAYARTSNAWGTSMAELSFDPLRRRAQVIADGALVPVNSDAAFKFNQTRPDWNAVALRSGGGIWKLETRDVNFTTPRALSTHSLPVVLTEFCVANGNVNPMDTMGIMVSNFGTGIAGVLQFSQATGERMLKTDAVTGPFSWTDRDIIQTFDYRSQPGADSCFALAVEAGDMDLGMAVFRSDKSDYYASRYEAFVIADNGGAGQNEYLTFQPEPGESYGIIVWANNVGSGRFTFANVCQVMGDVAESGIPAEFSLRAGQSGVMSGPTRIYYDLPKAATVTVRVFDAQGRAVRTLAMETHDAGHYQVAWDGRSASGKTVAAGTYYVRLQSKEFDGKQKLVKVQ